MILTEAFPTVFGFKLLINCCFVRTGLFWMCHYKRSSACVLHYDLLKFYSHNSVILNIFKRLNYKLASQLNKYLELSNHFTSENSSLTIFLQAH